MSDINVCSKEVCWMNKYNCTSIINVNSIKYATVQKLHVLLPSYRLKRKQKVGFRHVWAWILAPLFTSCVILNKIHHLSVHISPITLQFLCCSFSFNLHRGFSPFATIWLTPSCSKHFLLYICWKYVLLLSWKN